MFGGVVSDVGKIPFLATGYETFRHRFQFLPPRADLFGLVLRDFVISGGLGDDRKQIREFLDNLVGGWNQVMRMRGVPGVENEKAPGALANPLDEPMVPSALEQRFDAVKRVAGAAARGVVRRLGPFIDHRKRQAEIGGDLFGRLIFENLAQQFVGLHDQTMKKPRMIGKREAGFPS
jgi:hypothetical protein